MKQVLHNGLFYTMQREGHTVESLLIEDGIIVEVGKFDELKHKAESFIDVEGATVFPGFVDSHIHMIGTGRKMLSVDLSTVTSAEEMLQVIEEAAKKVEDGQWIFVESFNENNFSDKRIPTIQELDAITSNPLLVSRVCRHVFLGNSEAFRLAKMDATTADPEGGIIGRDANGQLNGLVYEKAGDMLQAAIPREGEAYVKQLEYQLSLAIDEMHKYGLTGGHSEEMAYFGSWENTYEAYRNVLQKRQDFRANLLIHNEVFEEMMEANLYFDRPFMQLGAMKIFADGSFGGSTAALIEPYSDNEQSKGLLIQTDEQADDLFQRALSYGRPIAVHTIGDAAAEQMIRLMEKYAPPKGLRHRLIHACLLNESLIERLSKLDVVVDVQPTFVTSDFPWVSDRIGKEREQFSYPWRSLIEAGIYCAGSSDSPIEVVNPLVGIHAAVTRRNVLDEHEGYVPNQKISLYEAIYMYTVGSAQAISEEANRGIIQKGYVADFTILEKDPFSIPIDEVPTIAVARTIVNGRTVFQALNK